jgi:hypothetical protein
VTLLEQEEEEGEEEKEEEKALGGVWSSKSVTSSSSNLPPPVPPPPPPAHSSPRVKKAIDKDSHWQKLCDGHTTGGAKVPCSKRIKSEPGKLKPWDLLS